MAIERVQKLKIESLLKAAELLNREMESPQGKATQLVDYLGKLGARLSKDQAALVEEPGAWPRTWITSSTSSGCSGPTPASAG